MEWCNKYSKPMIGNGVADDDEGSADEDDSMEH